MSKYNVGDKFVFEIKDVESGEAGEWYSNDSPIIVGDKVLDMLERLDSAYVNEYFGELQDEAYKEGRDQGITEAIQLASGSEEDMYNEGVIDALQCVEKLLRMPVEARRVMQDIIEMM